VPAGKRAAVAIATTSEKSDRAVAEERPGKDGKSRKMPTVVIGDTPDLIKREQPALVATRNSPRCCFKPRLQA
jgi:hypothetical protein